MCGGDIQIIDSTGICECEYCGSRQTVPKVDNEKLTNLFNRANRLRSNNEFDKASSVYENIIAEHPEESEAYWGLCLCKYGIEYVDDPATAKKIPTCHRTSYDSIFSDNNFELALEYADEDRTEIYRAEAKEIDRIQKRILDIAKEESPYDVFICYKETDRNGERTKDSVLAQDIYDALVDKGFKVFFSRISLEDKLGKEFEPYIFSALNTAKVMLAIGTSYENYNSVWVKNEWSRFIALMKNDHSKTLIPCYADIDAYDMPDEFKNLQGQDLAKLGAIQDIVRGVQKIFGSDASISISQNNNNYIKRGQIELNNHEWKRAQEHFDQALNANPENVAGYIGKILALSHFNSLEELQASTFSIIELADYKNALQFGSEETRENLQTIAKCIEKNKKTKKRKNIMKTVCFLSVIASLVGVYFLISKIIVPQSIYYSALNLQKRGEYEEAISRFDKIKNYRDSDGQIVESRYLQASELMDAGEYESASQIFADIAEYKDVETLIKTCSYNAHNQELNPILELYNNGKYEEAYLAYIEWVGEDDSMRYEHSEVAYSYCMELIAQGKYKEALAIKDYNLLDNWFDDEEYICATKYAYVKMHKDNSETTAEYLDYLVEKEYLDSQQIYDDMYSYKMVVTCEHSETKNSKYWHSGMVSYYANNRINVYIVGGKPLEEKKGVLEVSSDKGKSLTKEVILKAGEKYVFNVGKVSLHEVFTVDMKDSEGNIIATQIVDLVGY